VQTSLLSKCTRFRAYQLGNAGSSFSYFDGNNFTLIEARLTDLSRTYLEWELRNCGRTQIYGLHITSWDVDHCAKKELEIILKDFRPTKIEYPGYDPHTDTAAECLSIINTYKRKDQSKIIQKIDPPYIKSLENAENWGYKDVIYHPKYISEGSNCNSTVKLFRTGCFNVASLGDVDNQNISAYLKSQRIFYEEVDIMILAHHGADNGFTTASFIREVRPTIAICSSNYDNQFEHPKPEIKELLYKFEIPLYTTKTGDVVVAHM